MEQGGQRRVAGAGEGARAWLSVPSCGRDLGRTTSSNPLPSHSAGGVASA